MSKAQVIKIQAEPMIVSGEVHPWPGDGDVVYTPPNEIVDSVEFEGFVFATSIMQAEEHVILSNVIEVMKMSVGLLRFIRTSSESRQGGYNHLGKKFEYFVLYPGAGNSNALDDALVDAHVIAV